MMSVVEKTRRRGSASKARWLSAHMAWFEKVSQGDIRANPNEGKKVVIWKSAGEAFQAEEPLQTNTLGWQQACFIWGTAEMVASLECQGGGNTGDEIRKVAMNLIR